MSVKHPNMRLAHGGSLLLADPSLRFVYDYWTAKRAERAMPQRSDISIADLKPHLGWMMLVEALPQLEDFRYRLVGSYIAQYFLADARGMTMREAYALGNADAIFSEGVLRLHRRICRERTPFLVQSECGEWRGHLYPAFNALYLPLGGSEANMVFTTYAFHEPRV